MPERRKIAINALHSIGVTGFTIRSATAMIDARYLGNYQWNVQLHKNGKVEQGNSDTMSVERSILANFDAQDETIEVFVYR